MRGWSDNREFLAAMLHGRRGRLLEGERLMRLCGADGWESAVQELGVEGLEGGVAVVARGLWRRAAVELGRVADAYGGEVGEFLRWWCHRFLIRDCCLLIRAVLGGVGGVSGDVLISGGVVWDAIKDLGVDGVCGELPRGGLRERYGAFLRVYPGESRAFLHEAVLERAYLEGLAERVMGLGGEDGERVRRLVETELMGAELLFLAAGRFVFGMGAMDLDSVRAFGEGASRPRWEAAMGVRTLAELGRLYLGVVLDLIPEGGSGGEVGVEQLERLVWLRHWRVANRVFRGSAMSYGVAVGYAELRWLEVSVVVRLMEGLRLGLGREVLGERLSALQGGGGR